MRLDLKKHFMYSALIAAGIYWVIVGWASIFTAAAVSGAVVGVIGASKEAYDAATDTGTAEPVDFVADMLGYVVGVSIAIVIHLLLGQLW